MFFLIWPSIWWHIVMGAPSSRDRDTNDQK